MRRTLWNREQSTVRSEINVTSLVDVTLVLLIIFLVVAPVIQQGIQLKLPTASTKKMDNADNITVSINGEGRIYFGESRVTDEELEKRLGYIAKTKPDSFIVVRADRDLKFNSIVKVLDIIRNAGLSNTGIATENEKIK
ncbi:MAG TPA: biopolymer transporter ExbD [bacterium]|nr:biopolymer transporter ExbD [bacterium]